MGVMCAPIIFQGEMPTLMEVLEYEYTYLDYLLVLSRGLKNTSNIWKNYSSNSEILDYLEFVVTREGSEPQPKKIEAILKLDKPKRVNDVHRLLGMVQYYQDLWDGRSWILAPYNRINKWE